MDAGTLTVEQLARGIDSALSSWFGGELWVQGEIDSLRRSNTGHAYFQLIERSDAHNRATARIDVALLDAARRYVNAQLRSAGGVRMTDGMQVRIRGRLEYYAPQGRVQLRMSGIDPAYTLALLVTERDRVLAVLDADDLLARNRALRMPALPLRVGLATSNGSAAMADFVNELATTAFAWQIRLVSIPVQGRGADHVIARAIDVLIDEGVDVVALVRGGGSRLDLATFDSEAVARAIAASTVPVLTGIGHEIDTSVADVVAHSSFKTPTACAAALVNRVRDGLDRTEAMWSGIPAKVAAHTNDLDASLRSEARTLARLVTARIETAGHRLETRSERTQGRARERLATADRQLALLGQRLRSSSAQGLKQAERQLEVSEAAARGADPARLMRLGWSITRTSAGTVVRDIAEVASGDRLVTSVAHGVIESEVVRTNRAGGEDGRTDGD